MDLDKLLEPALLMVVAAALGVGGREWIARARSGTRRMEAEDSAQVSILDGALHREAALLQRIDALTAERDALRGELEQARTKLTVVQMVADNDPKRAVEITQDSAFVDMSRPLRPRPQPRPTVSPMDPFQAADPYAPPPRKR